MSEKPIIFSGPMVQALLDDRKTQTRRVTKEQDMCAPHEVHTVAVEGRGIGLADGRHICEYCPYGQPGDRLYVKETWAALKAWESYKPSEIKPGCEIHYKAGPPPIGGLGRWRSARFMPKWASRITLEITGIRVERVQDISEADAKAEGVEPITEMTAAWGPQQTPHWFAFMKLWDSLNANRLGCSWADNPYVWVIEFKRIEP